MAHCPSDKQLEWPSISVVMPVLNSVSTVEVALESVFQQNASNLDIVIIDGGSTDGTLDVIAQYSNNIDAIEVGKDSCLSDALNRGLKLATGDFVAILNADDHWMKGTIQSIRKSIEADPGKEVYCGKVRIIDPSTGLSYTLAPKLAKMKKRMSIFHSSMFISKNAYDRIGGYSVDYHLAMDSEWCHRAICADLRFGLVDDVLASMRLEGISDIHFLKSLLEYRKSAIQHKIATRMEASFYFLQHLIVKLIFRNRVLRSIKQRLSS